MEIDNTLVASPFGRRRPAAEPTGEPFNNPKQSIVQLTAMKKNY